MSIFKNNKWSFKKKFVFTFALAFTLGAVTFIYFAFIKQNQFISKAIISLNLSSKYKTLYGIYEDEYSDSELFKLILTDSDLVNHTTDSLKVDISSTEFQKEIKWNELSATESKSVIEISFKFDRTASTILRTHLYFYEKKINAYLEKNMLAFFNQKLSNEIPALEAELDKTAEIVNQLEKDLEEISNPIDMSNVKYGLPIFNPSFSTIKENIEVTKLQRLTLQKRIAQKKDQLGSLQSCQCLANVNLENILVNVIEITESDKPTPKNAKRNAAIAFSGVMLFAFFIFALSKMTYIPND